MFNFYSQLELLLGHEIYAKFMFSNCTQGRKCLVSTSFEVYINNAGKKYSKKELLRCSHFSVQEAAVDFLGKKLKNLITLKKFPRNGTL